MDPAVFDELLGRLEGFGPEFGGGFSNHGPMAAEALVMLGLADEAPGWVEQYRRRLEPAVPPAEPVDEAGWRGALGDSSRYADWEAYFRRRLGETQWEDVVAEWGGHLLPGLSGAATHGVIRTAHAVRMAEAAEARAVAPPSGFVLDELGCGLAYWAASYERLPGTATLSGRLPVGEAAAALPPLPPDLAGGFFIDERLAALAGFDAFPAAVDALAPPGDVGEAFSRLTAVFAGAYLANAEERPVEFVHTVTGPAAVRLLLPYLPHHVLPAAFAYAWQVAAGIHVACAGAPPVAADAPAADPAGRSWDEAAHRALAGGDEHAIKMVEACRREDDLHPDPRYLAAAWHVAGRLGESG